MDAMADELQRRTAKRREAVEKVKKTVEYQHYVAVVPVHTRQLTAPQTPRYGDMTVTKRQWERMMGSWKRGLREWNAERPMACVVTADGRVAAAVLI